MKMISRKYMYDDQFFTGKIPEAAINVRPRPDSEYPVYLKEGLLSPEQCNYIADGFTATGPSDSPGTRAANSSLGVIRKAYSFELTGKSRDMYDAALASVADELMEFFDTKPVQSTGAHGLGYTPGCKYDLHADNCDAEYDESGNFIGFKHRIPQRHLSTLLFLSDSVEEITGSNQVIGGNLSFRFLVDEQNEGLLIEPKRGLFIAFPCDPVYAHEVHEVYEASSDYRFAIVDWHSCLNWQGSKYL